MPPVDWNRKDEEWKDVLKKPKNLGLRAGGTGVGALLRAAHTADHAFQTGMAGGHQTMPCFRALETSLGNLGNKCKEVSDKHKKLFTEACASLDAYRQQAVARRNQAQTEVDQYCHRLHQEFQRAANSAKQSQTMEQLEVIWDAYLREYEHYTVGFARMAGYLNTMKGFAKPTANNHKSKEEYVRELEASSDLGVISD